MQASPAPLVFGVSGRACARRSRSRDNVKGVGRAVPCSAGAFAPRPPRAAHASSAPGRVPVGAEQEGDACGHCSLLSSIAQ